MIGANRMMHKTRKNTHVGLVIGKCKYVFIASIHQCSYSFDNKSTTKLAKKLGFYGQTQQIVIILQSNRY